MKVDLTLSESKTKVSLSLENKPDDMTWSESDPATWGEADSSWAAPKIFSTLESKTKLNLSLESK